MKRPGDAHRADARARTSRSRRSRPVNFDITVVGVRSHTGEVMSVYLMDADIEKLMEFLQRKHDQTRW